MNLKVSSVLKSAQKMQQDLRSKLHGIGTNWFAWKDTFLDEVHEAKLRNKESEQSLDQIFNEVATA